MSVRGVLKFVCSFVSNPGIKTFSCYFPSSKVRRPTKELRIFCFMNLLYITSRLGVTEVLGKANFISLNSVHCSFGTASKIIALTHGYCNLKPFNVCCVLVFQNRCILLICKLHDNLVINFSTLTRARTKSESIEKQSLCHKEFIYMSHSLYFDTLTPKH